MRFAAAAFYAVYQLYGSGGGDDLFNAAASHVDAAELPRSVASTSTAPIFKWLMNTAVVTSAVTILRITTSVLAGLCAGASSGSREAVHRSGAGMGDGDSGDRDIFPIVYIFKQINMLNSLLPLILPSGSGVMCIYLIYNFLLAFPRELEEAGLVEGANVFQVLWHIVLPSVKPVVITQAFITFSGTL